MEPRRKKKIPAPYDIWTDSTQKPSGKLHPSWKRDKKNPLPHPGQSYHPDPEQHRKLLKKILDRELEYNKHEAYLQPGCNIKFDVWEILERDRDELESGIKHLIESEELKEQNRAAGNNDDSATDIAYSDYDDKDLEAIARDKRVQEKRKSRQQRLRQHKDRLQRRAAKLRKLKKIRLSKFDGIKKITKELDKKEKEAAIKASKKKHKRIKNERLGQKFEPSDPIYCLSDELPSNLRQVSCPMSAVVREQLESFQSRLMVEPTSIQVKKRKYRKREFERKTAIEQDGG